MSEFGGGIFEKVKKMENEYVTDEALANHVEHKIARGGKIYLTNKRLIFIPHKLDSNLGANILILPLEEIDNVGYTGVRFTQIFSGGLRRRLSVTHACKEHLFVINKLDYWINEINNSIKAFGKKAA